MEQKVMIKLDGLKKYFSISKGLIKKNTTYVKAVDDISLEIKEGEIVGLVGESGSGKTTLARVVLNLTKMTGGNIIIDGIDMSKVTRAQMKQLRSEIAVVFQDPASNLNPVSYTHLDVYKRQDKTEYPLYAVREAILNAVIHRDYSVHTEGTPIQIDFFQDRLEIRSPGTLYGRMTVDQLGFARPDLRNPAMAMMAECLTEAENRYSGIPTIRREMKKYGLEPPVFENRRNEFVVILYNETHQKERRQRDELYLREKERQGAAPVSVREQRLLYDGEAEGFIYGRAEVPGPSEVSEASGASELSGSFEVSEASVSPGAFGAAGDSAEQRILAYCRQPRLKSEIAALLGIQTSFYVMKRYVTPLVKAGKLALTLPEKPQSKLQRYVTTGK